MSPEEYYYEHGEGRDKRSTQHHKVLKEEYDKAIEQFKNRKL